MSGSIVTIIEKKRDGHELTAEEINFFVQAVADKSIENSQIGALLMAIYLNDMTERETAFLTTSMTYSGDVIEFPVPEWKDLLVDKHSTGGVGDKVSLILVPALAALGFKVPMVSGRGLDITGGTLDKLESIPGFQTVLTKEQMFDCLKTTGCFIGSATSSLAPADKILYQQRDVTRTVASLPLIVSSILSKKLAEGTKALVMDITVGRGTFLKTIEDAHSISRLMVSISKLLGLTTKAVVTRMDNPLGRTVGDALEISETIECLKNNGPPDLMEVVTTLGGVLLVMKGRAPTLDQGKEMILEVIASGGALDKFEAMLTMQGVTSEVAKTLCKGDIETVLKISPKITTLKAVTSGYIQDINAFDVGTVWWNLGGGRSKASDDVDHTVGLKLLKTVGDKVEAGEPWVRVHHASDELPENLRNMLNSSIVISNNVPNIPLHVVDIV